MILLLILILKLIKTLEMNSDMGFAKSVQKEKLIVVNGVYPVEFNLQFENQLLEISEVTKMTKIGDFECSKFKVKDLLEKVNFQLSQSFTKSFEPLIMDIKSKERSERGIAAAIGMQLGVAVADKLVGKAIDFLFDSRRRKTEHAVSELRASLQTIKNDLEMSALELCTLGKNILEEKINRIASELSFSIESQIKSEIQKLYFGELDNKYKLSACLALNEQASKYDCLKIIRSKDFEFNILEIDLQNENASIQIQILTPILSKVIIGHTIFNFGTPKIENDRHFLVKGLLPNFITTQNEYSFLKQPKHQVIEEHLLVSSPKIDHDCFKNITDSDHMCDAIVEVTSAKYMIKHINGYTILINFVECSFTHMNVIDEPKFLNIGTHMVSFDLGFLTCGKERLAFSQNSISYRKHISYSNYKTEFNFIERDMFLNVYNKNILDEDHVLSQVSIFPNITLRLLLITIVSMLALIGFIFLFCFYTRVKKIYRNNLPPALVY